MAGAGEADGVPFLVMELIVGTDLSRRVRVSGPLPPAEACEVVRQAAIALAHAHTRGLVHRDVKPSNLLLTPDGTVKLLDLGLALAREEPPAPSVAAGDAPTAADGAALTGTGVALGTRDYMAPEQQTAPHAVDARADVYGLGATLHFLLTGRPPGSPGPLPAGLAAVLRRMLAERPADRYATAAEVAAELGRRSRGHDLPALAAGRSPRSPRRRLLIALSVVAVAGLAIAIAVAASAHTPREQSPIESAGVNDSHVVPTTAPQPIPVAPAPRLKTPPSGRLPMTLDEAIRLQREWAEYLGQPVVETGPGGVKTVLVPPGEFELAHRYHVTITRPYRLGTTEVTREQFQAFVTATKYLPSGDAMAALKPFGVETGLKIQTGNWREPGFPVEDNCPITHVSRADAQAFVDWLSKTEGKKYRLPTEAEWRWACRSGAATRWHFGNDPKQLGAYANHKGSRNARPARVAVARPNAWGLHDMLGNVREWVADGHLRYPEGRFTDPLAPPQPDGAFVLCGGDFNGRSDVGEWQTGWRSQTCDCSTIAGRIWHWCLGDAGFRVCRDP